MTELVQVKAEDRERLWNLHQKYLYEMTNFYDNVMDEKGNIQYGYFDAYFREDCRKAYFIYSDYQLTGFLMIHPYSYFGGKTDYVLAEFTVFPRSRRQHIAYESAELLFCELKGRWEVKYHESNLPAKKLWNKVTEKYAPQRVAYTENETVLLFSTEKE